MTRLMREAVIDAAAISANASHFRTLTGVEVVGVVKANGYGHGAFVAARAALEGGASRIGVADIAEGVELRRAGVEAPILAWLHGLDTAFGEALELNIEIGVSSRVQLAAVAAAVRREHPAVVHLKLDTGLSRNGIEPERWEQLFDDAARLERAGRIRIVGIFSHLANTSRESNARAVARFESGLTMAEAAGVVPEIRHLAATHAAIESPEARFDAVRIGIGLYGLSPFAGVSSAELGLRPAMTLRSAVTAVRRVPVGTGVSYDHAYRSAVETTLVLVPLGYADGVPRQASERGPVTIGGRTFNVAGRIAMDQFVVDVGDMPVSVGDEVVIFGDPEQGFPAASDWGDAAGTINYEIVTRIGARVQRR